MTHIMLNLCNTFIHSLLYLTGIKFYYVLECLTFAHEECAYKRFAFRFCNGNGRPAVAEYEQCFQNRWVPHSVIFCNVHRLTRERRLLSHEEMHNMSNSNVTKPCTLCISAKTMYRHMQDFHRDWYSIIISMEDFSWWWALLLLHREVQELTPGEHANHVHFCRKLQGQPQLNELPFVCMRCSVSPWWCHQHKKSALLMVWKSTLDGAKQVSMQTCSECMVWNCGHIFVFHILSWHLTVIS
jgi:hypothetical protein